MDKEDWVFTLIIFAIVLIIALTVSQCEMRSNAHRAEVCKEAIKLERTDAKEICFPTTQTAR